MAACFAGRDLDKSKQLSNNMVTTNISNNKKRCFQHIKGVTSYN